MYLQFMNNPIQIIINNILIHRTQEGIQKMKSWLRSFIICDIIFVINIVHIIHANTPVNMWLFLINQYVFSEKYLCIHISTIGLAIR